MDRTRRPSWQTRLLNTGLRRVKKRTNRHDIAGSRDFLRRLDRFFRVPRDIELIDDDAAGVQGQWIVAPGSAEEHVILYLHGGGFCLSESLLHKKMVAKLCRLSGFRAFMPFYRLAPEDPFPAGLDDCVASYRWLVSSGYAPGKIVIAGDSAGGGLTFSTIGRLRDAGDPLPACAVTLSAGTDLSDEGMPDAAAIARDPMLPWNTLELMREAYLGDADPTDPFVSPVYLDYRGFPPLLLHAGSTEIVCDHSIRVAESAHAAGVDTRIKIWEHAPHVFQGMGLIPEARLALREIADFIVGKNESG